MHSQVHLPEKEEYYSIKYKPFTIDTTPLEVSNKTPLSKEEIQKYIQDLGIQEDDILVLWHKLFLQTYGLKNSFQRDIFNDINFVVIGKDRIICTIDIDVERFNTIVNVLKYMVDLRKYKLESKELTKEELENFYKKETKKIWEDINKLLEI